MTSELLETRIRDNVWVWSFGGGEIATSFGANCVGVIGETGVLLVDPLIAPVHARRVEAALRVHTDLPVKFVVLTHHHTDHALGASWFAARGAAIVCHRGCREGMAAHHPGLIDARRRVPELVELFADAEPCTPALTFENGVECDIGSTVVEIFHPGPGHTAGDSVLHLPRESVAICGDLVSNGYHVNYEDSAPDALESGLSTLRAFNAESYIPGHGAPGGKDLPVAQARYHELALSEPKKLATEFSGYKLSIVLEDTVRRFSR